MRWVIGRTEERRATRMHQMMARLHVDVLALIGLRNGDAYAEARSRCLRCDDSSLCLCWLDKCGPNAGPDFCPNLEFFSALQNSDAATDCGAARVPAAPSPKSQSQDRS